jgi:3-hydroxyisobutyrate dehydrogenase
MGAGMVTSLRREGFEVAAWNRTRTRAEPLAALGAMVVDDAVDAVDGAEVVLTMLYDADSVLEVMADVLPAMPDGAVWVQSSTIGQEGTRLAADLATTHGVAYVDAPMLGTKTPAEKGLLVVLAAGDPHLRARLTPVFDAVGGKTLWVGDEPGPASALKLVCNAWVGSVTAAVGQSVALAGQLGLDPRLFLDAIAGGPLDSAYAQLKGGAMIDGAFDPQFELDGVRKDLGLIRAAEAGSQTSTVLTEAVLACFDTASERGHGGDDMAAVVSAFRPA